MRETVTFFNEQKRVVMLYHFRRGYLAKESFEELQNRLENENEAPNHPNIHKWFQRFLTENFSIEDGPRSGRPRTSTEDETVAAVKEAVDEEPQINVKRLMEILGLPKTSI